MGRSFCFLTETIFQQFEDFKSIWGFLFPNFKVLDDKFDGKSQACISQKQHLGSPFHPAPGRAAISHFVSPAELIKGEAHAAFARQSYLGGSAEITP